MPIFNYKAKEIIAKIVFYGPGLCGKTTSLQHLHEQTIPERKGELYFLATETDQTIYFELVPMYVGEIRSFKLRFQVYTVPGQVKYNNTRKAVLQGVDSIVFVADSQRSRRQANVRSFENLKYNLKGGYNILLENIPLVYEYNKRDMPDLLTIQELNRDVNPADLSYFETIAITGEGVVEAFEAISSLTIQNLEERVSQLEGKAKPLAFKSVQERLSKSLKVSSQRAGDAIVRFGNEEAQEEFHDISRPDQIFDIASDLTSAPEEEEYVQDGVLLPVSHDEERSLSYADIFAVNYQDGEVIFQVGEVGDQMYFIEEGRVRIVGSYKLTKKVLAIYEKGDFFGEMAIFGGKARSASAVAIGATQLLPVTKDTLAAQIQSRPEIGLALLKTLSGRIRNDTLTIGRLADQNKELRQKLIEARDTMKHLIEQNKRLKQQLEARK